MCNVSCCVDSDIIRYESCIEICCKGLLLIINVHWMINMSQKLRRQIRERNVHGN